MACHMKCIVRRAGVFSQHTFVDSSGQGIDGKQDAIVHAVIEALGFLGATVGDDVDGSTTVTVIVSVTFGAKFPKKT